MSGYTIAGIILIIIAIILLIIGYVTWQSQTDRGLPISGLTWFLFIGAVLLGIIGIILLAFSAYRKKPEMDNEDMPTVVKNETHHHYHETVYEDPHPHPHISPHPLPHTYHESPHTYHKYPPTYHESPTAYHHYPQRKVIVENIPAATGGNIPATIDPLPRRTEIVSTYPTRIGYDNQGRPSNITPNPTTKIVVTDPPP